MTPLTPREDDPIKQLSFDPHIGRALKDISSQSFYRMRIVDPANFVYTIELDTICISEKKEVLTNYYEKLYEFFVNQGYTPKCQAINYLQFKA